MRRVVGGVALLLGVMAAMALLVVQDAAGRTPEADVTIRQVLTQHSYLPGFALIYIEESGVPLFIAGDAFLLYVGHRLPDHFPLFFAAWLSFTLAVTLGATNLYFLARRYGRRLVEHRLAGWLHLTPARLDRAHLWFERWGPWALIFGRHLPGLRVPLTVAAGILMLPYRVFAISVAVSSSAWAATFLLLGALFGDSIERSIRGRPVLYGGVLAGALVVIGFVLFLRRTLRARSPRGQWREWYQRRH